MIPGITTADTILVGLPGQDDPMGRERYIDQRIRRLADDATHSLADTITAYDQARMGCSAGRPALLTQAATQAGAAREVITAAQTIATELARHPDPDVADAATTRARELADSAQLAAQMTAATGHQGRTL